MATAAALARSKVPFSVAVFQHADQFRTCGSAQPSLSARRTARASPLTSAPPSSRKQRLSASNQQLYSSPLVVSSSSEISYHRRHVAVSASASASASSASPKPASGNPLSSLVDFFSSIWEQCIVSPLGNFGFGKKSIWEGGVGLFLVTGMLLVGLTIQWTQGVRARSSTNRYQACLEFSQACGITVGTPVRIRGVDVGSVIGVRPSLERIDAMVEILDSNVVIPRNSLIEVNQSGLISETLIDITPLPPMPEPTVGPLDPACSAEGLIVCDRERIEGQQGVSLDELIANWTKIAKDVDKEGVGNMFSALDKFAAVADEAKPLLEKVNSIVGQMEPMLLDVKDGELLKNLEALTKVASAAAEDLRTLNSSILTTENTELLRQSVSTLTKTLKHVEAISADISGLTGDPGTRNNLKQIIESLSRLVSD